MGFALTFVGDFFCTKLHGSLLASPTGRGGRAEGHKSSLGARLAGHLPPSAIGQSPATSTFTEST